MLKMLFRRSRLATITLILLLAFLILPLYPLLFSHQPARHDPLPTAQSLNQGFTNSIGLPAMFGQSIKPLVEQAKRVTAQPLTIKADTKSLVLTHSDIVGLLAPKILQTAEGKEVILLAYNEVKIHAVIDGVVNDASVTSQPTIMAGNKIIRQGTDGIQPKDNSGPGLLLAALIERQTGTGDPSVITIPMVKITSEIIQQPAMETNNHTGTGVIRLTFDDGPGGYTNQILDILKAHNVHATFYVIGRHIGGLGDQMQRTINEGHRIGNHAYNHLDLTKLPEATVRSEIVDTQDLILQTTGKNATVFRPPFGAQNANVRNVASSLGLSIDLWSVDPQDWTQPGGPVVRDRVLQAAKPGSVVLLHVLYKGTVDALPEIIEGLRARGFTLE